MSDGRFLLLLDLLGFKQMIEQQPLLEVVEKIETVLLDECEQWAPDRPELDFDTIQFSDTVVLFSRREGALVEWYDDLVYIGSRICTRLLADRIPVRGALTYGSFIVKDAGRHKIFAGKALVEAHIIEQSLNSLGFVVSSEVRHRMYKEGAGPLLQELTECIERPDGSLMINFLTQFHGLRRHETLSNLRHRWEHRTIEDLAWLDTEVLAFAFVVEEARRRASLAQCGDRIAQKYVATDQFLRSVLGEDLYEFAESLIEPVRAECVG